MLKYAKKKITFINSNKHILAEYDEQICFEDRAEFHPSLVSEMAVAGTTCYYHIARHNFSGHRNCDDRGCCNSNTDNPCCYGDNNYYDKLYTSPV